MKLTLAIVGSIIALIGGTFFLTMGGQEWDRFFGVRQSNIKHEKFKAGRAYTEGMLQELVQLRMEYVKAKADKDKATAEAIAFTIRHKFADTDHNKLPVELQEFVSEIFHY
jgi:hypothetical protein